MSIGDFYDCIISSILKEVYALLGPPRRVEGHSSREILGGVADDIDTLQSSAVGDGQRAISVNIFVPRPNLAEKQANSPSNGKGVSV